MNDRHLIVVDTETTGLTLSDIPVEIAWLDLDTGERGSFIPQHDVDWVLANAHPRALEINGYRERLRSGPQDDGTELARLHAAMSGNIVGGSNVRMDVAVLGRTFAKAGLDPEPGFYHLAELSSYACGVLGLDLADPPGLGWCCELLGVEPGDHTASGDVRATAACFRALTRRMGLS